MQCKLVLSGLVLVLVSLLLMQGEAAVLAFKENAADFVKMNFKETFRMGKSRTDFTRLEIVAKPSLMVAGYDTIDKDRVTVEIKSDEDLWKVVEEHPTVRGGVYTWTVPHVSPCKTHSVRLWLHGKDGSQASYQIPGVLPAADSQAIARSGYQPGKPSDLRIVERGNSLVLGWSPAHCVDMYDVTYQPVSGGDTYSRQVFASKDPEIVISDGIESCSEYEVKVAAVTGDEYSDDAVAVVSTKPEITVAERLEPDITPSTHGVTIMWDTFAKLSCIEKYLVRVCKAENDCPESKELVRDNSLQFLKFSTTIPLEICSDYTVQIKPLYAGLELMNKVVKFRTSSPVLNSSTISLDLQVILLTGQVVRLGWSRVQCARQYLLYQKENTAGGKWESIGATSNNYFEHQGVPCTEYRYGMKVAMEHHETEMIEYETAVMTQLDKSLPYVAPSLDIEEGQHQVQLSWDHGRCIDSYRVRTCRITNDDNDCHEKEVFIDDDKDNKVLVTLDNLRACTDYSLQIFPTLLAAGELDAEGSSFRTASLSPTTPSNIMVGLNMVTNKVDMNWSSVECATGYRVHQQLAGTQTEFITRELVISLDTPSPCSTYRYSVIINKLELSCAKLSSVKFGWVEVIVKLHPSSNLSLVGLKFAM